MPPVPKPVKASKLDRAIARAVERATKQREKQRRRHAEARTVAKAVQTALRDQRLPTGQPVRAKRPGPPRRGRTRDPEYLAWVRTLPCTIAGLHLCEGRIEAHHVQS